MKTEKSELIGRAFVLTALALLLIVIPSVSAYTKLCLRDCQGTPANNPRYVCDLGSSSRCNDPGYCEVGVTDLGNPTAPNRCSGQTCHLLGDNGTIDSTPPNLTVHHPVQNFIYNSRAVSFELEVSESSD